MKSTISQTESRATGRSLARRPGLKRVDDGTEPLARVGEAVLDPRRPRRDEDTALDDAGGLEIGEPLSERPRRDALERLLELVEADGACLGRGPQDREHPAPPEELGRAA